ncbi:MAG: ATP-binding cassette domain-containing protein [Flavihumibacter sp.]
MSRQINDKNKKRREAGRPAGVHRTIQRQRLQIKQATSRKKPWKNSPSKRSSPPTGAIPGIIFQPQREVGNQILNVEKLASSVDGRVLFDKATFSVNKGDKIAFLSKDPLAVTNFFEIITGNKKAEKGQFEWGTTITSAYLPLENSEFFTGNLNLLDWLRQYVPAYVTDADEPFLRGFLGKMLFSGDDILKKTNVLSGGEKVRCMISRMMLQQPNLVILDQPTNHLDLESIQSFNEGCQNFPGIVLMTSHDHTFIQTVANRIIELTPNGVIDRLMTFDEYLADDRVKNLKAEMYNEKATAR